MPEIKHNFTGGKMNKDLDERLVPNGEYRDAMNIEVLTSEGSDVGTAQNILGNKEIEIKQKGSQNQFQMPEDSKVIGSISDEKVDTLYYLITSFDKDMILGCVRNQNPFFVFVDIKVNGIPNVLKFNPNTIITGINVVDDMLFWTDNYNEPKKINIVRCKNGTLQTGMSHTKLINEAAGIDINSNISIEEKHITVIKKTPVKPPAMELVTFRDPTKTYTGVVYVEHDDGGFNGSSLGYITPNSTLANGGDVYNFNTIDPLDDNNNTLNMQIEERIDASGNLVAINSINDLTGWQVGSKLLFKAFDNPLNWNDAPGLPLTDYVLKGEIVTIWNQPRTIKVKFTSQDGQPPLPDLTTIPPQTQLKYAVDLFSENERLWEFKFPRFSYRYKYEDGEYSPFAPFTQVAFAPGAFDYHPRKGYNIGMTNRLKEVNLSGFINSEMDQDIVSIDILFKDEPSSAIYIVDTIRPNDDTLPGLNNLNWWDWILNGKDYVIKSETVNNIIPSNQLLRPWDNVPRRALAQEVTGNRIVYGNYVQNMDLITSDDKKYYADFKVDWAEFPPSASEAVKSCKSLREYQLGVVFTDKYGRETPVLSNTSGTLKLPKNHGSKGNRVKVGLAGTSFPIDITHLKWFIKETANEYYNMAMDRWYYAEDGNIWLGFPSSDRNKVDIDTFLILKKGTDLNDIVEDAARYKILAIENEAPEFIKTSKLLASSETHWAPSNLQAGVYLNPGNPLWEAGNMDGVPFSGGDVFSVLYNEYKNSPGRALHEYRDGELWVEFGLVGEDERSDKYKVVSLGCSRNFSAPSDDDVYNFQMEKPFGDDINFLLEGSPTNPTGVKEGVIVNIYKHYPENLPQFDGKFFVKIYFDDVFKRNIQKTYSTGAKYRIVDSNMVYRLKEEYIEQFTHRMNWWWTPGKDSSNTYGGASILTGTRGSDTYSGLDAYSWEHFSGLENWKTAFYRMGNTQTNFARAGISNPSQKWPNYSNFKTTNAHAGMMGSDKYAACNIWFKRFLPPSSWITGDAWPTYGMPNWHNARYSGSGDKRDIDNWEKSPSVGPWVHGPLATPVQNSVTANYTNVFTLPDVMREAEHEDARDSEVWFIDEGRVFARRWNNDAEVGGIGVGGPYTENDSRLNPTNVDHPTGIIENNTIWDMTLSFGGIGGAVGELSEVNKDHFNVGGWNLPSTESANSLYSDLDTTNFVGRLNPGNRFRWKNDPTKTIYTVPSSIYTKNYIRHSTALYTEAPSTNVFAKALNFDHSHNFTKTWRVAGIEPALEWNPTEEGQITNGLAMSLTICSKLGSTTGPVTTTGNFGAPDGEDVAIYVTDLVPTIGNSNYYNEGNPALHEGMALKAWDKTDPSGGYIAQNYKDYTNGYIDQNANGKSSGNDFLVVRKIEEMMNGSTTYYKLTLGGYNFPMQNKDHEWLYGTTNALIQPSPGGTYRFVQVGMNGQSPNSEFNINQLGYKLSSGGHTFYEPGTNNPKTTYTKLVNGEALGKIGAVGYELQFIEEIKPLETISENPAIWETEPKESKDLDIYYEASETIPINFDKSNIHEAFPIGSILSDGPLPATNEFTVIGYNGVELEIDGDADAVWTSGNVYNVTLPSGLYFGYAMINANNQGSNFYIKPNSFIYNANYFLPYHNCYSFGNGVESNRIRDNYNLPYISNGVKASTTLEQEYKEERRKYGLIYSGIYNSTSGVNNLNQFIQAEKITKDINPIYGSIQKLHTRDTNLITLCEDKCLKILANKDAVYNADGNPQLIATENVLGQTTPFRGEYGISTNPESFASEAYRAYFSDRVRGTIMRLSIDGLTPISDAGMKDWFRDHLNLSNENIIGSYDDRNGEYNIKITLGDDMSGAKGSAENGGSTSSVVLTYNEKVKGWVSFKSFVEMEHAISMANDYYTFKGGKLFKHYIENISRNTFYGKFTESTIDVVLNDNPAAIKVFNTLNYEGSQSKIDQFTFVSNLNLPFQPYTDYTDQSYYNLNDKSGWYVESIITNKEKGYIKEFIEKEGKWFNNINRIIDVSLNKADTNDFTFQGIGEAEEVIYVPIPDIVCPEVLILQAGGPNQDIVFVIPDPDINSSSGGYISYNWSVSGPGGYSASGFEDSPPTSIDISILSLKGNGMWTLNVNFNYSSGNCTSSDNWKAKLGCTNPQATNYSWSANIDNGTCQIAPL